LVGPGSTKAGRVELYFDGEWSTVCNDGWDDTDAGVVCRQLGFGSSGITLQPEPGRGLILLDDVNCFGNESSLLNCRHNGIGISNCNHVKDAGVNCTRPVPGKHLLSVIYYSRAIIKIDKPNNHYTEAYIMFFEFYNVRKQDAVYNHIIML